MIQEKSALLNKMPLEWLQQQVGPNCPLEGVQYASLMSSVATFQDHVVVCYTGSIHLYINLFFSHHIACTYEF